MQLDDIIERSDRYNENNKVSDSVVITNSAFKSLPLDLQFVLDSIGVVQNSVEILDTNLFIDRFGADTSKKITFQFNDNPVLFYVWQYRDSSKTKNAFYNWLDCFGAKCKSLKIGDRKNLESNFTSIWVGEKNIVYLNSKQNFDSKTLERIVATENPGEGWKYIIIQRSGGAAAWYKYDDEGKLELLKKDI